MTRRRAGWIVAGVLVALAMVWPWRVAAFLVIVAGVGMALNALDAERKGRRRPGPRRGRLL